MLPLAREQDNERMRASEGKLLQAQSSYSTCVLEFRVLPDFLHSPPPPPPVFHKVSGVVSIFSNNLLQI